MDEDPNSVCLACEQRACQCGGKEYPVAASLVVRVPRGWSELQAHTRIQQIQTMRPWVMGRPGGLGDGVVQGSLRGGATRAAVPSWLELVSLEQGAFPIVPRSRPPNPRLSGGWADLKGRGVVKLSVPAPLSGADHDALCAAIRDLSARLAEALKAPACLLWATKELVSSAPGWSRTNWLHPILVVPRDGCFAWVPGSSQKPLGESRRLSDSSDDPWKCNGDTWIEAGRLLRIDRRDLLLNALEVGPRLRNPAALASQLGEWRVEP